MLVALIFVIGIALVVASFVIPEKMDKSLEGQIDPKAVKALMDKEMERLRTSLDDAAEDCVNDKKDELERSMDRITNEKMLAISEYSDTVLDRIHKNHEEAMFLYDMLNNKHSQVKNTAAKITEIEKNVKSIKEEKAVKSIKEEKKPEPNFQPMEVPVVKVEPAVAPVPVPAAEPVAPEKPKVEVVAPPADMFAENVDLMLTSDNEDASDKDKIIELHAQGKSNMAIAKELGMGIGEVKLILDLYK